MSLQFKNSATRYGIVSKSLHWSIALLFALQFLSILCFRFLEEQPTNLTWGVLNWHKSLGLLILILGIARLIWRRLVKLPDWPDHFSDWDKSVTHFAEYGLYVSIFLMTISGLVIELSGGHYIPFFGLFYVDNLSPYIHFGPVSYDGVVMAARAAKQIPVLSNSLVVVHIAGAYGVLVFFTSHIFHVIKHQQSDETKILGRMLPQKKNKETDPES